MSSSCRATVLMRPFGDSGLVVSALGFGAGHIGDEHMAAQQVERLLDAAVDLGVTFFDTARGYGLSEERLGRWLPRHRAGIVLSTKVGYALSSDCRSASRRHGRGRLDYRRCHRWSGAGTTKAAHRRG